MHRMRSQMKLTKSMGKVDLTHKKRLQFTLGIFQKKQKRFCIFPINRYFIKEMLAKIALIITLLSYSHCGIPLLNDNIGQAIFHQAHPYLIYVCNTQNENYLKPFEEYCGDDKLCAILDSNVEMYAMFRQFVSMDAQDYLLILDAQQLHKFTLPLDESVTTQKIEDFYKKFKSKQWPRFYTSERIPEKSNDPYLKKIVGKTFKEFYEGPEKVKVLYLYSDNQGCDKCKEVYDMTVEVAKKFTDRSQVAFGSLDPFRNEHQLLNEVEIPVVVVYVGENKARLTNNEQIKKLESIIAEKLAEGNTAEEL